MRFVVEVTSDRLSGGEYFSRAIVDGSIGTKKKASVCWTFRPITASTVFVFSQETAISYSTFLILPPRPPNGRPDDAFFPRVFSTFAERKQL
jgi:hypothetical protein